MPLLTETETPLPTLTPLSLPTETETPTSDLITICHPQQIVHYAIGAGEIDEDYQNSESVLGEIDPEKYLALGLGGEITLSFAPYTVLNQTNQDFSLHIGNLGQVDVFVSPDGITWYQLVTTSETFDFDLAGLSWIQYIRVQDVSYADDFDADDVIGTILEGITAFACTLTPQIPQILPTLTPTSTPTFDGNHISEPSATLSSTETIIPEQTSTPPFPPTFIPDLPTIEPTNDPILTNYPPFERLGICFVSHLGENFTEWRITNPNPSPLSINPLIELKYEFYAFDEAGEVVQEALDWDNLNPITPFAQSIWLRWYLEINGQPTEILDFEYIYADRMGSCDPFLHDDLLITQDLAFEVCDVDCLNTFNQAFTTTSSGWEVEYDFRSGTHDWMRLNSDYREGEGFYIQVGTRGITAHFYYLLPNLSGQNLNINYVEIEYTSFYGGGNRQFRVGMAQIPMSTMVGVSFSPTHALNRVLSSTTNLNATPNYLKIEFFQPGPGVMTIHRVRFAGEGPSPIIPTPTPTITPTPTPEIVCVVTIKINSENPILGYATPIDVLREINEDSVIDISGRNDIGIIERWQSESDIVRATVDSVEFWFYSGGGNVIDVIDGDCNQLPLAEPPPFEEYNIVLSDSWTPEERADIESAVRNTGEALYALPNSTDVDGNPLFTNPFESPVEAFNQVMTFRNIAGYIYLYRANQLSNEITFIHPSTDTEHIYKVTLGACLTVNDIQTIICNWGDGQRPTEPEYTIAHEFGHIFNNQSAKQDGTSLVGRISQESLIDGRGWVTGRVAIIETCAIYAEASGSAFNDPTYDRVAGTVWRRGERGWGSGPGSIYSPSTGYPDQCVTRVSPNFSAFQQNPAPHFPFEGMTELELRSHETAADMFLNWVYRINRQGGFLNRSWKPNELSDGQYCHQITNGCADLGNPGDARFNWMNDQMKAILSEQGW